MKALILKDLYGISFQLKAAAVLFIVPYLLLFLAGVGMSADGSAEAAIAAVATYGVLNYIMIVAFSSLFLNTVAEDIRSGWARFSRTLPLSTGRLVAAKLAASLVLIGALVLLSLIAALFPILAGNPYVEILLAVPFAIGCLQAVALMPVFPLALRFGVKTANALYVTFTVVAALIVVVLAFMVGARDIPAPLARLIFYGGFPLAALAATVLSYRFGVRALEETEEV